MTDQTYAYVIEGVWGMILIAGTALAIIQDAFLTWLPALALSGGYLLFGFLIPADRFDWLFFRYCIGQAAVIALWLNNVIAGAISQCIICAAFLIRTGGFSSVRAKTSFGILLILVTGGAMLIEQINHTLIPGLLVCGGTGIAFLYVLIADFRIAHLASGDDQ